MPRQPRKPVIAKIEEPIYLKILSIMKSKPIYTSIIILTILACILLAIVFFKTSIESPKQNITNVDHQIELQLEKQRELVITLEKENSILENNLKTLEKRTQAHTELLKRMCEYIIVITVDKKIIPRQCLPEYKWGREEYGN
jgi:hypothetical protein